jgi:hypothetical protein
MSEIQQSVPLNQSNIFSDSRNMIIIVLLVLFIFLLLGINLLSVTGNVIESAGDIFGPVFKNLLSMIGYSTGELIITASDTAATGANLGVDIAKGTSHSIGDLLKNASKGGIDESQRVSLQQALNMPRCLKEKESTSNVSKEPQPIQTSDPVVSKSNWCYVGDFNGTRGCVEFSNGKCATDQIFPNQAACLA